MTTSPSEYKLSMKLFIDTRAGKVLFAEAEKDCVDFLFQILSLHVCNVITLLKDKGMNGCLFNLYESVNNLKEAYIESYQKKDYLLNLKSPVGICSVPFLLLNGVPAERAVFCCSFCPIVSCYSDDTSAVCPNCLKKYMTYELTYIAPTNVKAATTATKGSFVKEMVTYMVMDDLVVKPLSTTSSIAQLLIHFNVKDVTVLQEKVVNFGMEEALALLKACFESKTVLTSVFMGRIKQEK